MRPYQTKNTGDSNTASERCSQKLAEDPMASVHNLDPEYADGL